MPKKRSNQALVLQRIKVLFQQADAAFSTYPARSHRYVGLARTLAMKAQMSLPKALKRKFCKHCYRYLRGGVNCKVRTRKYMVVISCAGCKRYMRFPYGKRLKKSK